MTHPIIDAEKLEEELKRADAIWSAEARGGLIVAAAREYLSALPRWKEIEVVRWATFDAHGDFWLTHDSEEEARKEIDGSRGWSVVRLTGTAKVKVTT